jgi:hypothetical protein
LALNDRPARGQAALLEQLAYAGLVCGVALGRRGAASRWDSLAVWTRRLPAPGPGPAVAETRRALGLRAYVKADYHYHAEPRAEGASPLTKMPFPRVPHTSLRCSL